jgi:hypothetical protein
MAGQYRIKRRIAQQLVQENGQISLDAPRGYDYESIFFRLYGQVNVTTAFAGGVRAEAPVQLIKRIELVADGKNTIASVPFVLLNRGNPFRRGNIGSLTPPSAASIAAYQVEATGALDQAQIDGIRSKDSNLRTSGMSLLQIRFTFGAVADIFQPGAGVGTLTNMYVDVYTSEMIELPDAQGNITKPLYLVKRAYQDIAFTTSNANMQVILPVGNILRGVVIRAEGSGVAGEPSNAVLNNVQLASGVDVRLNLPAADLQAMNKLDYDIASWPAGIYVADLMTQGGYNTQASEGWDLTNASEAKLILDVTGGANTKLTIETIELIR